MLISKRRYQQMLDEHDTDLWYRDKRIRELEQSLTAERVLRTTLEVKLEAALEDNKSLISQRDRLGELSTDAKQALFNKAKRIKELERRLGSIESRWGTEAAI